MDSPEVEAISLGGFEVSIESGRGYAFVAFGGWVERPRESELFMAALKNGEAVFGGDVEIKDGEREATVGFFDSSIVDRSSLKSESAVDISQQSAVVAALIWRSKRPQSTRRAIALGA